MIDTDPRSAILFAESLVPHTPYSQEDALEADDAADSGELIELWLIAEIDAAIEALVDGAEVFTLGELVRTTPAPKTGALPGLVMVHYERRVDWTEDAEAFTIEDADTDDEDGEDWDAIDPALYVDGLIADGTLDGGPCNCDGPCVLEVPLMVNQSTLSLDAFDECSCGGCQDAEPDPLQLAAYAHAYATKLDAELDVSTPEPLFDPAGEYPPNVHTCQACRDEIAAEENDLPPSEVAAKAWLLRNAKP